jgi:flagellin
VTQLVDEINRIASNTSFNGNKLLNGDIVNSILQVGANVGETISVRIDSAEATQLSRQMRRVSAVGVDARVSMGSLALGTQIDPTTMKYTDIRTAVADDDALSTSNSAFSAIAKAAAINDAYEFTGVKAIVGKTTVGSVNGGAIQGGHTITDTIGGGDLTETDFFVLNGMKIAGFEVLQNDSDNSLVDAINAVIDETGVLASLDGNSNLVLTAEDGRNIEITLSSGTVANVTGITGLTQVDANGNPTDVFGGEITFQSNQQIDVVFGGSTNQALGNLRLDGVAGAGTAIFGVSSDFSVETLDISTRESSNLAIQIVDLALEQISAQRASLGAIQNRLESTINNLTTNSENLSASRSRIFDADFAAETANFSRNQIIQQAGVSILAQANQQPQIALSLLGQ